LIQKVLESRFTSVLWFAVTSTKVDEPIVSLSESISFKSDRKIRHVVIQTLLSTWHDQRPGLAESVCVPGNRKNVANNWKTEILESEFNFHFYVINKIHNESQFWWKPKKKKVVYSRDNVCCNNVIFLKNKILEIISLYSK
jgi:hypothetical protein